MGSLPAWVEAKLRKGWSSMSDGSETSGIPCAQCGHRYPRRYLYRNPEGKLVCEWDLDVRRKRGERKG